MSLLLAGSISLDSTFKPNCNILIRKTLLYNSKSKAGLCILWQFFVGNVMVTQEGKGASSSN
jgi:hypothetical protein